MTTYHLAAAWNWEHDAGFIRLLDAAFGEAGCSLLQVTAHNLPSVVTQALSGETAFQALLDRASDDDPRFLALDGCARLAGALRINRFEKARRAWNKAAMHMAFLAAGICVPQTVILPSCRELPDPPEMELMPLLPRFTVKPACRGGGEGVLNAVSSWSQVLAARRQYPDELYLLQASVEPVTLGPRLAWFRVLYSHGQVFPCWWDIQTHVYMPVSPEEENRHGLSQLRHMASCIAHVCELELFSTEIALCADGSFYAVDYVNDPIDLRLQSMAADGVPDNIVNAIAHHLVDLACGQARARAERLS